MNIGKMIIEYKEENHSSYGDGAIKEFSEQLRIRYEKGFDRRNVYKMRKFYEPIFKSGPRATFHSR